ncbi:MAG: aldo/keto reductase [Gammaproteobacteria bacterium]|nr:aldo/keto reductase [Gammaproteobacteria bacterium]
MILPLAHQSLGQTDIDISAFGLGTVKFGRDQQVKYPWEFDIPDDDAIIELLSICKDWGVNLIDTAPAYGHSEQRLGQLIKNRQEWAIVSKVGENFTNGQSLFDFSAQTTINTVDQSLQRLKTDYIDVILVHSDGNDNQVIHQTDVVETLIRLKESGKIRAYGLSTKTTEGGLWTVENTDVVMAVRNQMDHTDDPVLDKALELNKGVLIKKGLLSGHADTKAGGGGVEQAIDYVFSHPAVNCLISGTINPKHLIDNIKHIAKLFK